MSQYDFGNLESPLPGSVFINTHLEPWRDALHSFHSGTTRPDYVVPGMMWWDVTTNPWVLKAFQGSDDVVMGTLDTITNSFTPSGGFGMLLVSGTDTTMGYAVDKMVSAAGVIITRINPGANEQLRISLSHTLSLPWNAGDSGAAIQFSGDGSGFNNMVSLERNQNNLRFRANDAVERTLQIANAGSGKFNLSVGGDVYVGGLKVFNADGTPNFSVSAIPVGTTIEFNAATPPDGFLEENGAAVSRSTYATLFAVIGTTFGAGDGSTTFNLPNSQRRVTVGRGGTGTGTLGNAIGNVGGAETHGLSTAEGPSHGHGTTIWNAGGNPRSPGGLQANGGSVVVSTDSSGSGAAHNNMQPSIVKMKAIKY